MDNKECVSVVVSDDYDSIVGFWKFLFDYENLLNFKVFIYWWGIYEKVIFGAKRKLGSYKWVGEI